MTHIFVYGTLRRGECNHRLLEHMTPVAWLARTVGVLFDTGYGYPTMLPKRVQGDHGKWLEVQGELYNVDEDTLQRLDRLEDFWGSGDPRNLYERVLVEVETDLGVVEAWTYVDAGKHEAFCTNKDADDYEGICTNEDADEQLDQDLLPLKYGDWKIERMLQQTGLLYFAYGSCMDVERIEQDEKGTWFQEVSGRGVVEGFSLQFTRRSSDGGRADLVESGGVTEGKLYWIPLAAFEGYLCQREGVAAGIYRPAVVPVLGMDGIIEDALTFVVVEKGEELPPPQHYMIEILRGAEPVVSEGYYQQLFRRFVNDFGFVMEEI